MGIALDKLPLDLCVIFGQHLLVGCVNSLHRGIFFIFNHRQKSCRKCNLSYVLWVAAQVAGVLGCATLASIAASLAPSSAAHSARAAAAAAPPLLEAVNRHPLSLFLLANLLTGACNLSMDTMAACDATAAAVLAAYMLAVCAAAAAVCRVTE